MDAIFKLDLFKNQRMKLMGYQIMHEIKMNKIHQEGYSLPVKQALIDLLFKDLTYSAERGGYHPVEIRIISRNDEWHFDYITDFSYMGRYTPNWKRKLI